MTRQLGALVMALVTGVTASLIGLTLTVSSASAANCVETEALPTGGVKCVKYDDEVDPGNPGGGENTSTPPPCDLSDAPGADYDNPSAPFCKGTTVCQTIDLFAPLAYPKTEKPSPDSKARLEACRSPLGTIDLGDVFWSDEEEPPTLTEQAQTAVGMLQFATPTVGVSPETRTLVNLDTWFWLDGVQGEVSASAFTLTVTARLKSVTVDPGDGGGSFVCDPVPTTAAAAETSCTHEYRRASVRGTTSVAGKPAYQATVTSLYELTYTNGGQVLDDIPGAQATINGAPGTTAVRVDEAQTVVRPNR